jgi:hypothetical protein
MISILYYIMVINSLYSRMSYLQARIWGTPSYRKWNRIFLISEFVDSLNTEFLHTVKPVLLMEYFTNTLLFVYIRF